MDFKHTAEMWKAETGCEVRWQVIANKSIRFDLFGSASQVNTATRAINKWMIDRRDKSAPAASWTRTPAFDPDHWWYKEFGALEAERKQMFLRPMPEDRVFPHRVI